MNGSCAGKTYAGGIRGGISRWSDNVGMVVAEIVACLEPGYSRCQPVGIWSDQGSEQTPMGHAISELWVDRMESGAERMKIESGVITWPR